MTLSFQTHHNGLETGFVERIWDGFIFNNLATEQEKEQWAGNLINPWFGFTENLFEREILAKIHTIRADPHDRWRAGMPIHFVINNRTPQRRQFAPVLPCVSTQKIKIEKESIFPNAPKNFRAWNIKKFHVWIDKKPFGEITGDYDTNKVQYLAIQDGFRFDWMFMRWWPEGIFEGKIIHWTNFRYAS